LELHVLADDRKFGLMRVVAAEKTEQRKSEETFLRAARDGSHETVTSMVLSTS